MKDLGVFCYESSAVWTCGTINLNYKSTTEGTTLYCEVLWMAVSAASGRHVFNINKYVTSYRLVAIVIVCLFTVQTFHRVPTVHLWYQFRRDPRLGFTVLSNTDLEVSGNVLPIFLDRWCKKVGANYLHVAGFQSSLRPLGGRGWGWWGQTIHLHSFSQKKMTSFRRKWASYYPIELQIFCVHMEKFLRTWALLKNFSVYCSILCILSLKVHVI